MWENGKYDVDRMMSFFDKKYGRALNPSMISTCLSDGFKYLDEEETPLSRSWLQEAMTISSLTRS